MLAMIQLIGFGARRMPLSPKVISRASYGSSATATSHSVPLPGSRVVGKLLFMVATIPNSASFSTPAGWTQVSNVSATNRRMASYTRVIDGSEGSTVSVSISPSSHLCAFVWQIDNWDGNTPTFSTLATGTSAAPDAGAVSMTAGIPALVLAVAWQTATSTITAGPAGYANFQSVQTSNNMSSGTAEFESLAASEDPGAFTSSASNDWLATAFASQGR
jgi:hypothetical protein